MMGEGFGRSRSLSVVSNVEGGLYDLTPLLTDPARALPVLRGGM
jgi:hypothetical protein